MAEPNAPSQDVKKTPATRRWLKLLAGFFGTLVLLLVMTVGALWWWSGTDNSLPMALRWIARHQPLTAEGAVGSLRNGGRVQRLVWQNAGLTVEARDVSFAWQPWSLLHGVLKVNKLSASLVTVNDQRPASTEPIRPPDVLMLPLAIALDDFFIARFDWLGPPAWQVNSFSGNYGFDGVQHQLALTAAQVAEGRYQGKATLGARQPLRLDAMLSGSVAATVPGTSNTLPLMFSANAKGPLADLAVTAALQLKQAGPGIGKASLPEPQATLTARITPWAPQPLPEADASFRALDLALLWPDAPQTLLTGQASVQPLTSTAAGTASWRLQAALVNKLPGPLDTHRLPLESLKAAGEWRSGLAVVQVFEAGLGGGQLTASGQWASTVIGTASTVSLAKSPDWKLDATLQHINPAAIHSQFAALPVDGRAAVRSLGPAIGFDASLLAAGTAPVKAASSSLKADPTAHTLRQLRLRDASATGSWNGSQAGGTLVLSALAVRTDDAELKGSGEIQAAARAGKGHITLTAPGLVADVNGELRPADGAGKLSLQARDMLMALRWLQRLPGAPAGLATASATGQADLALAWQGGWQDPALQGRLSLPVLDWNAASASTTPPGTASAATSPRNASNSALKLRNVLASVNGKPSRAEITLQGKAEAGGRNYTLQLAADGGRAGDGKPADLSRLAASNWQAAVSQLSIAVEDPALGSGAWRLATRAPFELRWLPGNPATLQASAGEAILSAPVRNTSSTSVPGVGAMPSQASLSWQPIRWRGGELQTAGKLTGLPLAWLELVAGPQLAGAGLTGNLVFDGSWDATVGDTVNVKAALVRSSGDITVQAETTQGAAARVAAGVREARLSLQSNGEALTLALRWDSERAGSAEGELKTQLARSADGGWNWPAEAPLTGQLKAQLPRIGVWSVLAPPGWRLRGSLATDIAISGTRSAPRLAGELLANDLALRSVVDGIEFGNGRLRAQLDGTRMRISEFTLQGAGPNGAGGSLTAKGEAAWQNGQPQVELDATLDHLRASLRTDRQITLSGSLQARLEGKQTRFGGALKIDQARILLPDEGTPQLGDDVVVRSGTGAAAGQKAPAAASATTPAREARAVKLDVQLDLGQDFRVQGKGIDTRVRGVLALTGESLTEPRLAGTVNTFGGQYRAYGQRLDVEQGLLRFTGPIDNPALDILAIRPNLTQRVGVQITGTALLPRVRLYAQPELTDAEKLSWLVLGRSSASGGAEATLLQQAALALLGSKSGGMSGGLAASLGLDELSFRGSANNADGTTTEGAITLGKRFSRNFYAAYERSISGALGTLYIFYDLSQRFTVRAQTGDQSAVDLIFTVPYD